MLSKKIIPTLCLLSLVTIAGCSSEEKIKIVYVKDQIESTHITTVDKARSSLAIGGANVYIDNAKQFTIVMPNRLTFNKDGSEISDWQKPYLNKLIYVLNDPNIESIDISSHYDNTYGVVMPQKRSEQYAYAFSEYINKNGLTTSNKVVNSVGTREPISQNENHYGNEANQRIELIVTLIEPENVQTVEEYQKQFDKDGKRIEKVIKKEDVGREIPKMAVEPPKNRL